LEVTPVRPVAFRLFVLLAVLLVLLAGGSVGFMLIEDLSFADSLYFTIVTVSTVGYGDINPLTTGGKALAVVLILVGVGTFLGVVADGTRVLLARREEQARRDHLNIILGVFFGEVGSRLLRILVGFDPKSDLIRQQCGEVAADWGDEDFERLNANLKRHYYEIDADRMNLVLLDQLLTGRSALLIGLLESPSLREHEAFTDVLRAVFHLRDELTMRDDLLSLPDSDRAHLAGDLKRAYAGLAGQWIAYMRHLKANYSYLFSLALRTSPFSESASAVVG
jgi:hypothetical protein